MATRTTVEEVKQILNDTELSDPIIEGYIKAANSMINNVLSGKLDEDTLEEIERWLTAHMIASTRERQAVKEGAGGAFIEYTGKFGEGLKSTSYGQMVLTMDTTGLMAALGMKQIKLIAIPQQ